MNTEAEAENNDSEVRLGYIARPWVFAVAVCIVLWFFVIVVLEHAKCIDIEKKDNKERKNLSMILNQKLLFCFPKQQKSGCSFIPLILRDEEEEGSILFTVKKNTLTPREEIMMQKKLTVQGWVYESL